MKRILIVEDDLEIVQLLEIHLKDFPAEIIKAHNGEDGLNLALEEKPDLMLLDISLPKMDGIEVCQKVRNSGITTAIVMLTARTEEIDRVLGLEVGADDYITKPFSVRELLARIKAIFRMRKMIEDNLKSSTSKIIEFGEIHIDIEKRKVLVNGKKMELSPKEFELLILLSSNPGRSYSRSQLLTLIWGYDYAGHEHNINSHINRLRAKIEPDMNNPTYILTTWGVGYRFNEEY